ncbi:MAG TPA: nucleotidyltransferase domain-containing protein, partial [Bryobacteraceae bacterium]|nr:nucleotidyltransferase domain-containing protein [Bryobacteraceae bacterium]
MTIQPAGSAVAQLEDRIGANWPSLRAARSLAESTRALLRSELAGIDSDDTSIVISGSLARDEFTGGSDIDWTLLIDGFADPNHQELLERIRPIIRKHAAKDPGRERTFGKMAFSHQLVHEIGGEDDTN